MGDEEVRPDPITALVRALVEGARSDPQGVLLYAAIAFAGLWALSAFKASLPASPQEQAGRRLAETTRRTVMFAMMGLQVVGMGAVYAYTRSVQTVGALLALYTMRWYLEFKGGTDAVPLVDRAAQVVTPATSQPTQAQQPNQAQQPRTPRLKRTARKHK